MLLSILVPSMRPEGLAKMLDSLNKTAANRSDIQVVMLVDDQIEYVEFHNQDKVIHAKPGKTASELMHECYKLTSGQWIMFGNDDITFKTEGWDNILREQFKLYPDEIALFWPDDNMFRSMLSCFPILSRKAIEISKLFPLPYRKYKIDDTIFAIFPPHRRIYLPNFKIIHENDKGTEGYKLPDGRIYPIDRKAADYDSDQWRFQQAHRDWAYKALYVAINQDNKSELKLMLAVPTAEVARKAAFYDYFNQLQKPEGTILTFAHGQSPAKSRNLMIEAALEQNCTHILFIDDDTAFKPDMAMRLLSHDKDIVTGLYYMRNFPHRPVIFGEALEDGKCLYRYLRPEDTGLIEIVAAGLGCCLIKTEVFRKMEKPWVRLGELESDQWCDDIGFFKRVREAGFKMYCDVDCMVGHMAHVTLWPAKSNNQWWTQYDTMGEAMVNIPQVAEQPQPVKEVVEA